MNARQLQQGRKVLRLLATSVAMTDQVIAAELGITLAELRPVLGGLYGQHRIDFAVGYAFLSVAPAAEEVKAA